MRIDVLGPVHPYRGGIAHHTARLARELRTRGHDVTSFNLRRQYPAFLFPGTTQVDHSGEAFSVPNTPLLDSMNPVSWALSARRVVKHRPDVLAVAWWHPFFAPSFGTVAHAARRAGIETVFVCHNVLPHESSPVDRLLARYAFGGASRFVVQAESERVRLEQLVPGARVAVCPHPAYDLFASAGHREHPAEARAMLGVTTARMLLFFGLIRPYKGLDILLEAFARVPEDLGITLYVAGECYGDEQTYRDQIERLNLSRRVRFEARYIANEEVPTLLCAADALVLPYRHATGSGVAQAAFACSRPVITTGVGGLPDVVHHEQNGLLVDPENPDALAAAIVRFYREDLAPGLQRGAHASAQTNTWAALAAAIEGTAP